jgi:hypothetical protein
MRFYALGNYYLSSIQQGIQAFHVLGEMTIAYPAVADDNEGSHAWHIARGVFDEWLNDHKTMICLNGGNNAALGEAVRLFEDPRNEGFPFAEFNEDYQSLDGIRTSVGIVLPDYIYEADVKTNPQWPGIHEASGRVLTPWQTDVAKLISSCSLAR